MGNLAVKLHLKDEKEMQKTKVCTDTNHVCQPFTCRDPYCGTKPVICIQCGFQSLETKELFIICQLCSIGQKTASGMNFNANETLNDSAADFGAPTKVGLVYSAAQDPEKAR